MFGFVVLLESSLGQFWILSAYELGSKGSFNSSRMYTIPPKSFDLVSSHVLVFGAVVPSCVVISMLSGIFSLGSGVVW